MAMTQADVQKLEAIEAKLTEIKELVMNSNSIRAVGGVVIANDLINLLPKVAQVKEAIIADVAEHAAP